jgi:hypothetical protein
MLSELLKNKSLFNQLYIIDKEIAEQYRQMPCSYCGGPLYFANYFRKPRGEPDGVDEKCFIRFSLCCGKEGCRHRIMPPSCRFIGQKVYWYIVILVIISDLQNEKINIFKMSKLFNISRNTIARWVNFFQDIFPSSSQWQSIRGRVSALITNTGLPSGLVNYFVNFKSTVEDSLISCLKFLSQGSDFHQKIRAG